ncbi:MAG TPA: DUF6531 domain-containing protein, partial [Pirellulaceae bacterium]|nr:DUF6531 domain-containing protein [Pirellulaceae bacterium]
MPSLTAMAMAAALKKAFQLLGKLGKAATRAFQLKLPPGSRLRNALCAITGHPVDVASGRVFTTKTDFELPGRIPIEFRRTYDTSAIEYEGDLGPGWMHSYELHLWEDAETGRVVIRDEEVNQLSFAPLEVGERTFEPMSRSWLKRVERAEYEWSCPDGLVFRFAEPAGAAPDSSTGGSSRSSTSAAPLRLTSIVDRNGNRIDLSYERGRLSTLRDSGGRRIDFRFESVGGGVATRLVEVRLALDARAERTARLAAFSYDSSGRLSIATDRGLSAWHYQYDDRTLVKETTGTGVSFHFEYKGSGASRRCVRTFGDGGIYDRRIEYDRTNRTTRVRDSIGAVTTFHLTAAGMPERIVDPNGATRMYGFSPEGWMLFELDEASRLTKYSYDSRGNIIAVAQPDGAKFEAVFDASDRLLTRKYATGAVERWEYDERGNVVAKTDAMNARAVFQRDRAGQVVAVTAVDGMTTRFEWNAFGQCTTRLSPSGGTSRIEYDEQGWPVRTIDAGGGERRYKHDARGRVLQVWLASGGTHRYRYDADGSVVEFRNSDGQRYEWRYSGYGFPAERIDPVGGRSRFRCDAEGRLVE